MSRGLTPTTMAWLTFMGAAVLAPAMPEALAAGLAAAFVATSVLLTWRA